MPSDPHRRFQMPAADYFTSSAESAVLTQPADDARRRADMPPSRHDDGAPLALATRLPAHAYYYSWPR